MWLRLHGSGGGEGGRLKTRASEINRKVAKFRRVATFGIF